MLWAVHLREAELASVNLGSAFTASFFLYSWSRFYVTSDFKIVTYVYKDHAISRKITAYFNLSHERLKVVTLNPSYSENHVKRGTSTAGRGCEAHLREYVIRWDRSTRNAAYSIYSLSACFSILVRSMGQTYVVFWRSWWGVSHHGPADARVRNWRLINETLKSNHELADALQYPDWGAGRLSWVFLSARQYGWESNIAELPWLEDTTIIVS